MKLDLSWGEASDASTGTFTNFETRCVDWDTSPVSYQRFGQHMPRI